MFTRNNRGERRVSPATYKLLLTSHIMTSVGWFGVVFAKLVLGLVAVTSNTIQLFGAMDALNVAFPPLAIGTIVSGVLLSVGTKWGLLQHYWVVIKLALTVGVIATAVQMVGGLTQAAMSAPSAASTAALLTLIVAHVLMLATATVLSIYKPLGRTSFVQPILARLLAMTIKTARAIATAL